MSNRSSFALCKWRNLLKNNWLRRGVVTLWLLFGRVFTA